MKRLSIATGMGVLLVAACLAPGASIQAASSLSNSLQEFSGNSTLPTTQAAVAAAGFDFFSTDGLAPDFTSNPTVTFDSAGAHFGLQYALDGGGGDGGRNYMRTIESDYATTSFVAEITFEADLGEPGSPLMQVFFGMGSGDTALFGVPDWSTQFSSTFVAPEPGFFKTWSSANDINRWNDNDPVAALSGPGTHRLRMNYNATTRSIVYSIDMNYAGGAFAADYTAPTLDLNTVNCPQGCGGGTDGTLYDESDGWPTEPSRIYWGGDDQAIFRDFSVVVGTPASANFNGDSLVDGADLLIWQRGFGINAGATPAQGDADGNGAVNAADLTIWKDQFGTAPASAAAVVAVSAVPEPTTAALLALAIGAHWIRRRAATT
ncbi:MAG: hypothetical protein DCC67_00875 [Planctomycetota bacterium]|nr:MAG: hypothetical protein DCC67_00875 [Planctomycetota bacterium]